MSLDRQRIAFIGCGAMGEAMIKGLLSRELIGADRITASHPREERRRQIEELYGVQTTAGNAEAVTAATVVVLTVKPQVLDEVLADLGDLGSGLGPGVLVMTIVAGVRMERLAGALGTPAVVRVMPNTPAQIGRGISVWTTSPEVGPEGREIARTLLSALGEEERVVHEDELDMATALSGTGPAYVFLFMEALIDAGVHLGFSRRVATRLVRRTVLGSVEYAIEAEAHPARLRDQVTSPGGTTAEALYQLEKGRLRTVLSDAVWAAYRRCVQLGRQADPAMNGRPLEP
jgi:pyrroline-5-carboxylate reductase